MARKLELKNIPMPASNDADVPGPIFSYGEMLKALLRHGPPGGLSFDEVQRSMDAWRPIDEAIAANADSVTLTDDQWRTVKTKLDQFQFAIADPVIVDFGLAIRNAPEIGT